MSSIENEIHSDSETEEVNNSAIASSQSLAQIMPHLRFIVDEASTMMVETVTNTNGDQETKTTVLGDFVLKMVGSLSPVTTCSVFSCKGIRTEEGKAEPQLLTNYIILDSGAFDSRQKFAVAMRSAFGAQFCLKGTISSDTLSYYYRHLRDDYLQEGLYRCFRSVTFSGYMGDGYWFFNDELHVRAKQMIPYQQHQYFMLRQERQERCAEMAMLNLNKILIEEQDKCITINKQFLQFTESFTVNKESLVLAACFALSRILRTSSAKTGRTEIGECKTALLYGNEMNVGKTLSQRILNYGQGASSTKHLLFMTGGDLLSNGTSTKAMWKTAAQTTMLMFVNDVLSCASISEFVLHFQEGLMQGSINLGMGAPKSSGMIISTNDSEDKRMLGRVVALHYKKDSNYPDCKENLIRFEKTAAKYSGFLTAWAIHFGANWAELDENCCPVISSIIQRLLPARLQRWCDAIASMLFTKQTFYHSLGKEMDLVPSVQEIQERFQNEGNATFIDCIQNEIISKIRRGDSKILTWLNWFVDVRRAGRLVDAVAIQAVTVKGQFSSITEKDLKNQLEKFADDDKCHSKAVKFLNTDVECTLANFNNKVNVTKWKAHKIPIDAFPESLKKWLDYGLHGGEVPEDDIVQVIRLEASDEAKLMAIQQQIHGEFLDLQNVATADPVLNNLTPDSKRRYETFTPDRIAAFKMGARWLASIQETMEETTTAEETTTSMNQSDDSDFATGTFGVFPMGTLQKGSPPSAQHTNATNNETGSSTTNGGEPGPSGVNDTIQMNKRASPSTQPALTDLPKRSRRIAAKKKDGYCICKEQNSGTWILCESGFTECPGYNHKKGNSWFHLECIELEAKHIPKGKWICQDCEEMIICQT